MKIFLSTLFIQFIFLYSYSQNFKTKLPLPATPIHYNELKVLGIEDAKIQKNKPFIKQAKTEVSKTNSSGADIFVNGVKVVTGATYTEQKLDTQLLVNQVIPKNIAFSIIDPFFGSYVIIQPWTYKKSKSTYKSNVNNAASGNSISSATYGADVRSSLVALNFDIDKSAGVDPTLDYYIIPKTYLLQYCEEFEYAKGSVNFGLMSIPVKIRPIAEKRGFFDFTSEFNLGPSLSYVLKHNWKRNIKTNFIVTLGITSFTIDSAAVGSKLEDNKVSAFSPAMGILWDFGKFQASVMTGIDYPARKIQQTWVYRNRPWFGIGFGLSLFKLNGTEENQQGKN